MSDIQRDPNKIVEDLGTILVTGGSGFVGKNFVQTLLDKGFKVKSFDLIASDLEHENLELVVGDICDKELVAKACEGVDTIFHTAAIICLKGGRAVTKEYRDQSYAINVEGTKHLLKCLQKAGGKRFIYTASNSVVIGGKPIQGGNEDMPYTNTFNDLYTETKVVAEKWVLEQDGKEGVRTCAIRPSGIWGIGDRTVFVHYFQQVIDGLLLARIPLGSPKLDNSYVHNLIHGQILAAQHLIEGGTACGQAYFINDDDPINMFDFSKPVVAACGYKMPNIKFPGIIVKLILSAWQHLHFQLGFPEPPLAPLAIDRVCIDNYFSVDKARKDLGYEPLYTTQQGLDASIPYYVELFNQMKKEAGK